MAGDKRLICPASALADGGPRVRFEVEYFGDPAPAFVVRHGGAVRGFLNRCSHVPMELDWQPGLFFTADREHLICSTHGAVYAPDDGRCLGGPCDGKPLVGLLVEERDGQVYFTGFHDGG